MGFDLAPISRGLGTFFNSSVNSESSNSGCGLTLTSRGFSSGSGFNLALTSISFGLTETSEIIGFGVGSFTV